MRSFSRVIKVSSVNETLITVHGTQVHDGDRPLFPEEPDDTPLPDAETVRAAMLEEASAEAERIRVQAREEGYRDGQLQAQAEAGDLVGQLVMLVQNASADQGQWARAAERDLVGMVLLIAERVIQRELGERHDLVVDAVRRGLQALDDVKSVRVRVNPIDIELLTEQWKQAVAGAPLPETAIVPDERVQRGGCIIEAGEGKIDLQKQTVLEAIERAFKEHWGEPV